MSTGLGRAIHRHLSVADERFGLRLGVGLAGTLIASVTFALLLLLVRAGWRPLRDLDTAAAETFNRIDADRPELAKAAEVVSDVFDPNVFRVALTVIFVYLMSRADSINPVGRVQVRAWVRFALFLRLAEVSGSGAGWCRDRVRPPV